jgi:hypothetical protein
MQIRRNSVFKKAYEPLFTQIAIELDKTRGEHAYFVHFSEMFIVHII